jgi:predicted nuclease of predicted toxin-antitoxin system
MRFLADENFPGAAVAALEAAGHDVVWMRRDAPGASDGRVLDRTVREGRILLTFDKDFGDLARASDPPGTTGIVLFRLPMPGADEVARRLVDVITARDDWIGHFSVVEPGRIRMRRLR